jgi:autotransporter-associated beta strand protein
LSIGDGQSQASLQSSVTVSPGATLDLELANGENFANAIPNSGTITLSSPSSGPPVMNNFTVSGTISGPGNLVKIGANTVTLAQSNTYTGGTAINAGTLITGSISGTGAGPVVVNASGALGGSGKITGPVTLNQGGTIAPGADAIGAPGSTLHAASLLWNPGGTLVLQLGGQADDALALTGALTKGTTGAGAGAFTIDIEDPASISLGDFTLATFTKTNFSVADFTLELPGNYSGHLLETAKSLVLDVESGSGFQTATTFDATGDSSQLSTVPEPGSATLLAFAGASLLARRRRRMS